MKKIFTALCLALGCFAGATAQNVQLHYDFASSLHDDLKDRPELRTTVEMERFDKWGNTYLSVDMTYDNDQMQFSYFEISRYLKFWDGPFAIHAEYNGGMKNISDAWLGGLTYTSGNLDGTRGYSVSALYKHICHHDHPHNFQLTGKWYLYMLKGVLSFTGYADLWHENHKDKKGKEHDFIFLAEPQFWVNLHKMDVFDEDFRLSIGTECQITSYIGNTTGWYVNPTLAVKWSF